VFFNLNPDNLVQRLLDPGLPASVLERAGSFLAGLCLLLAFRIRTSS
jgi:hypothetical protein